MIARKKRETTLEPITHKKEVNMKKALQYGIMFGVIAVLATGCKKEKDNITSESPSPTVTQAVENTTLGEPTLSEEAQKNTQFKSLKKGDTVAEVIIKDYGTITIKLFPKNAPKAVENFTTHAKNGYYDGLTFHRIIEDFMIQGGDPDGDGTGGNSIWDTPFEDEFTEKLQPYRGALCMANSGANTNGSQFFIVDADAASVQELKMLIEERYKDKLTFRQYLEQGYGVSMSDEEIQNYLTYGGTPWLYQHHTVFGQVMDGFDVLDQISSTKVEDNGSPIEPVVIETIKIYKYKNK